MKKFNVAWFPMVLFLMLVLVLGWVLPRDRNALPVTLSDGTLPPFHLPSLHDGEYYSKEDVLGEWMVVNIWASWCSPCKQEHPVLVEIAQNYNIPILGVNFKDKHQDAVAWLDTHGNPFAWALADTNGRLAFDWGIFGVPTTYLIAPDGRIAHQFAGILTDKVWENDFMPLIEASNET